MHVRKTLLCCCVMIAFSSLASTSLTNNDPLTPYQWHLQNSGQPGLATSPGVQGEDLNLLNTDLSGIRGAGVTVTVVDSGVELSHPDLWRNIAPGSLNLQTGSAQPHDHSGHGTAV